MWPHRAALHTRASRNRRHVSEGGNMPRYLVQRTFADGLRIPTDSQGAKVCLGVVETNATAGVTWVHSYVSSDKSSTFCVYDGANPEAIRDVAERNGLPVDRIT